MGWSSGNEIFDPVCQEIVNQVEKCDGLYSRDAKVILTILIDQLMCNDWDTVEGSLEKFKLYRFVVQAFKENGVEPYDEMEGDIYLKTPMPKILNVNEQYL